MFRYDFSFRYEEKNTQIVFEIYFFFPEKPRLPRSLSDFFLEGSSVVLKSTGWVVFWLQHAKRLNSDNEMMLF